MGRTVRGALQAGLQIAALIPGPQQPFVAAAAVAVSLANSTLFAPKAPRAAPTEYAIKTERPPRVSGYGRYKTFGAYAFYGTASDGTAVDVWAFHDGRIDGIEGWYLGDDKVTRLPSGFVAVGPDGRYGPNPDNIQIGATLGATPGTPLAPVIAKLPGIWTDQHRGDDTVTGYMLSKAVKAKNFSSTYSTGGPNQTPLGVVIRAQPVFDWRDPSQSPDAPSTWKWSENAVLHLAHYQLVRNGKAWDRHFAPTLAYWTAAANDADVQVPLKAGGTEPRYRSCVSHRHAGDGSEHKAVIAALIACFDGWMAPREDGALIVYSGRYYPPIVTLAGDKIVSYTIENGVEDEDAVNEIPVTYVSGAHDYNTVDAAAWVDEDDISARGAVRSDPLDNQVPSHGQARRLAKRKMVQARAPKRGTVTTTSEGGIVVGQRFIWLDLTEGAGTPLAFAPYVGPVEIVQLTRNLQTGAVAFQWRAADPNIDAWNAATEEGEPAPVGNRVAPAPLVAPTIVSITPTYGQNTAYNVPGVKLTIIAEGPARDDVTWYVRTRPAGGAAWLEQAYADLDPGASVTIETDFLPVGELDVEVSYGTGDGRLSPWAALGDTPVDTGNVLSDAVQFLTVNANADGDLITADWADSAFATSYLVEIIVEPAP